MTGRYTMELVLSASLDVALLTGAWAVCDAQAEASFINIAIIEQEIFL